MGLNLKAVFDDYPNPVYIIRPEVVDGSAEDFQYLYVNNAFCFLLGRNQEELVGRNFLEVFKMKGERQWLDSFVDAAYRRKHLYVDHISVVINKKMYTEIFHVQPDMCACIVHDFEDMSGSAAVENQALRQKANSDYMTGFYNRFYLRELSADISSKNNVGISFLDINNLKQTNDLYGHAAGDELILRIASMMRSHYRDSMIFRVGGDEFVIITEGYNREDYLEFAQNCKQAFAKDNLAAVGYAFFEEITDLQESLNQCDQLMYEQKRLMKQNRT
jgi:diguanylate cyclase (GGDEF)-like protein